MIKVGDWVIYKERPGSAEVLALVDKVHGQAFHLSVLNDGELQPFAIAGSSRVSLAPVDHDPKHPIFIDMALDTNDQKWLKKLRGTK